MNIISPVKHKIFNSITILIIVNMLISVTYAQSTEYKVIDFSVNDVTISTALVQLAMTADFNFSFNSDDVSLNKKITYSASKRSALAILNDILLETGHNYKIIGKQVVIYKDSSQSDSSKDETNEVPPVVITEYITNNIFDTVRITDTIIQIRTDTIRINDTVFIEKEKPPKPPPTKIKEIPVDYFNQRDSREKGIAIGINLASVITDFSFVRENEKLTARSFSLGADVMWLSKKWAVNASLKFTNFAEKFNHSYTTQEGGFFITDTIEEYYTIYQGDTTYYFVTDSTWKPFDIHEYSYNINNRIGILEFMASASYYFYANDRFRYYIKAGSQIGFLLYKTGIAIPEGSGSGSVDFDKLQFRNNSFSLIGSMGMQYRINRNFDFNAEAYYIQYLNDLVEDYPVSTKIKGVGLKFGVIYFF